MRSILATLAIAAAVAVATPGLAHEEMLLSGTVTRVDGASIEVRTAEGAVMTVGRHAGTRVFAGSKAVDKAELKVGRHVTMEGYGDSLADLAALAVVLDTGPAARAR